MAHTFLLFLFSSPQKEERQGEVDRRECAPTEKPRAYQLNIREWSAARESAEQLKKYSYSSAIRSGIIK